MACYLLSPWSADKHERKERKMRNHLKLTAVITAAAMIFASSGVARAADRHNRGMSTTEKVFTGIAIAAAVGLTAYAISKSGNHRYYSRHYYAPRSYVAIEAGFSSYRIGDPYGPRYRARRNGYWYNRRGYRFYRVPFVYNRRYDRAFNAGWERGYWAGYMQGLHESRMRSRYYDRFDWRGRRLWGYEPAFGSLRSYERGFHASFRIGYSHGFRGFAFGYNGFGFGIGYSVYR